MMGGFLLDWFGVIGILLVGCFIVCFAVFSCLFGLVGLLVG